ncbi:MAG: TraB/GumN family protein [Sphingomonadales bacterium]|nr:TraB/GumN family protein [Sphingomonadales bacterium]
MRRGLATLALLVLAACRPPSEPANPALWRVDGPNGERAWLFGTIHTLARPVAWRTAKVDAGLRASDRVMVEIAALDDDAALERTFAGLARTPGLPPLSARVPADERPALAKVLAEAGLKDDGFGETETWAAALMLASATEGQAGAHPEWGVDRAVVAAAQGKKIEEFEGAARQLAIFDRLPEPAQRRLLAAAVAGAATAPGDAAALAAAWRRGDIARIGQETTRGMLADPLLREALYAGRNRVWLARIEATMRDGGRPFVAVGTAHLAGPDGLPKLLVQRGYAVTRLE